MQVWKNTTQDAPVALCCHFSGTQLEHQTLAILTAQFQTPACLPRLVYRCLCPGSCPSASPRCPLTLAPCWGQCASLKAGGKQRAGRRWCCTFPQHWLQWSCPRVFWQGQTGKQNCDNNHASRFSAYSKSSAKWPQWHFPTFLSFFSKCVKLLHNMYKTPMLIRVPTHCATKTSMATYSNQTGGSLPYFTTFSCFQFNNIVFPMKCHHKHCKASMSHCWTHLLAGIYSSSSITQGSPPIDAAMWDGFLPRLMPSTVTEVPPHTGPFTGEICQRHNRKGLSKHSKDTSFCHSNCYMMAESHTSCTLTHLGDLWVGTCLVPVDLFSCALVLQHALGIAPCTCVGNVHSPAVTTALC